jgi:putrescine importer
VANFGSGMGAQIGAARLLYGMGKSNALPQSFFGKVDPKHHIPRNNVVFIGVIVLVGSFFLTYGRGIELLNFGALIAFMGVNAAAFMRYFVHGHRNAANFLPPLVGFFICLGLWWSLSAPAKILGTIWMALGIAFGIWKTNWFREPLSFELPAE